jgi:hypothetical protein
MHYYVDMLLQNIEAKRSTKQDVRKYISTATVTTIGLLKQLNCDSESDIQTAAQMGVYSLLLLANQQISTCGN